MNRLAEANIPIEYDKEGRSYKLMQKQTSPRRFPNRLQVAAIRQGLAMLKITLNNRHQQSLGAIESLFDVDSQDATYRTPVDPSYHSSDAASPEGFNYYLVSEAMGSNRGIRICFVDESGAEETRTISKPALCYDRHWSVRDLSATKRESLPLANIIEIRET
jgi:predicted DNA-binding transcriptional regulator YafY